MGPSVEHEIAVDLVGDHYAACAACGGGYAPQGRGIPLQSYGVVGVAEYHHARALLFHEAFQLVDIHGVMAGGFIAQQRVGKHLALVALDDLTERMVDRRLDEDLVAFTAEIVDGECDTSHDSGHECQFLAFHVEGVAPSEPSGYRLPVAVGSGTVAEHRVV